MLDKIAENWLGVPFLPGGYTKNGCDCVGLILGILNELQNIDIPTEYLEFGKYDHLKVEQILQLCDRYLSSINFVDIKTGDVLLFSNTRRNMIHFAVVSQVNPLYIIHTNQLANKVVENILDKAVKYTEYKAFRARSQLTDKLIN